MPRTEFKPGNMLYPLPAVLVSVKGNDNLINLFTVAWAGTVCTNPPMVSISVRKERFSYNIIKETGEFVINLTTRELAFATDYCGVKSGRDTDKWKETGLTPIKSLKVNAPTISESPVAIECKVRQVLELGSHDMFIADVVSVTVNDKYLDEKGSLKLNEADLIAYSHGEYYSLGEKLGSFGYSVRTANSTDKSVKNAKTKESNTFKIKENNNKNNINKKSVNKNNINKEKNINKKTSRVSKPKTKTNKKTS